MIVTGYFFVYLQVSIQRPSWPSAPHNAHAVVWLWYILLYSYYCYIYCYISLYICIISGIGSPFYVNPFYQTWKWLKLVLTVVYTVIYSYLVILLLYISIYTLSYYRNFVYSPQSTQLLLLVTQLLLNEYRHFSACLVVTGYIIPVITLNLSQTLLCSYMSMLL